MVKSGIFSANVLAAGLALICVPSALADTPCDEFRNRARMLATASPQATEDTGDGQFLAKVFAGQPEAKGRGGDCEDLRAWLKDQKLNSNIVDDLENDGSDILCYTYLTLFDQRKDGSFIALSGSQGSGHFPIVQILEVSNGAVRVGDQWNGDSTEWFDIVWVHGRAYPAVFTPKVSRTDLSYQVELFSVDPNTKGCTLSIIYQPFLSVGHWFGPKGENDVDPELRRVIAPIVRALATGQDVQPLITPLLDHVRGTTPYDDAISGYPDKPIDGMRYPNTGDSVYDLPGYVPFLPADYTNDYRLSAYLQISGVDPIPLFINGRRLLLMFGYGQAPHYVPPDAGFGIFQYNDQKRDFDGVAGGIMMRRGRNPTIE